MGKAIVVVSGKGGTGKTSFCAGVSSVLAARGNNVLVVDTDYENRNLDIVLGMTNSLLFSFADVILGRCDVSSADVEHPDVKGLYMLTAPAVRLPKGVTREGIHTLMQNARNSFNYVIVDCPAGINDYIGMFAACADLCVIVSTPDSAALRGGEVMSAVLGKWRVPETRLVINRVRPRLVEKKLACNIDDAMDQIGAPLLGVIPEDENVIAASNIG
ncbi:MAG: AAA family ATPase, partial [Bacillota bacterium]|nr:AAA family ATPase [Bacillota bacterium]